MKLIFYSDVKDGRLQNNTKTMIADALKRFNGKRIEIIMQNVKSSRSVQQNRFYWGIILNILSKELGYLPEEIHDLLKFRFLKNHVVIGDKEEIIVKSTASLTKSEFMDYVSNIQQWSAELGIVIPDPNTQMDLTLQ